MNPRFPARLWSRASEESMYTGIRCSGESELNLIWRQIFPEHPTPSQSRTIRYGILPWTWNVETCVWNEKYEFNLGVTEDWVPVRPSAVLLIKAFARFHPLLNRNDKIIQCLKLKHCVYRNVTCCIKLSFQRCMAHRFVIFSLKSVRFYDILILGHIESKLQEQNEYQARYDLF